MRSGRIRIKRYKTGTRRGPLLVLLFLLFAIGCCYLLFSQGVISLPSFSGISLSKADLQQEKRTLTLPGATHFALQLGVFSEKAGADALAKSYQGRGAGGYVYHRDGYRVLAAAYDTRGDAQAVQNRLADTHGVDAYLYPLTRSEVTLRLTGQKAQLSALSDAFDLCIQQTSALAQLSQSLDDGSMTEGQVRQALSSQQDTVNILAGRLRALFSAEKHPAVSSLLQLMDGLSADLAAAMQAVNATRLGSSIKHCHLQLICQLEAYVAGLVP